MIGLAAPLRTPQQSILRQATAYWKASRYSGSGQLLDLSGNGHHATFGSSSGADSNDPLFLPFGGTWHVYLPGVSGNYASVPDAAALDITGALDVDLKIAPSDWTSGANQPLLYKWNTTGDQRSYALLLRTTGVLELSVSSDGTAGNSAGHSSTAAVPGTDGQPLWVRVTYNGTVIRFYTSSDGETWTKLGNDVATSIASIHSGTATCTIGADNPGTTTSTGTVYRARIYNGLRDAGGTKVLDIDFTNPARYASGLGSLTAETGQTVTLNRSSSGRKLAVVDRPILLFGTDDYLEIPDHANLDFGATDSFTALVAMRAYGAPTADQVYLGKGSIGSLSPAYGLRLQTSGTDLLFRVTGGGASADANSSITSGGVARVIGGRRDVAADQTSVVIGGSIVKTVTDITTGTLENSSPLHIGRDSIGSYADFEFIGAAIIRRALSAGEIQRAGLELLNP